MRTLLACLLLLLACVLARPADADSWLPPRPMLASSEDGRWYAIVEPVEAVHNGRFRLVARAAGKPPRAPIPRTKHAQGSPALEPGDRLVAQGACTMPMEVRCLNDGKGLVLFEQYGSVGYGTSLEIRDGEGTVRVRKTLAQLFPKRGVRDFAESVSSIWWFETFWVDEAAGQVVIAWKAQSARGLRRVDLATGALADAPPSALLGRLARGSADERTAALRVARAWEVDGLLDAAAKALDDPSGPLLARLHLAEYLLAQGDGRGRALFAAAAQGADLEARRFAVHHLPAAMGDAALPLLQQAMRSDDRRVRDSAEFAFRSLRGRAVPMLIEMMLDESAPESYRAGAATALWNMPVEDTLPAKAALAEAAASRLERLAYAARHALEQIEAYER